MSENISIRDFDINWTQKVLLAVLSAIVLTATGPFGTYDGLEFWPRLAYWTGAVAGVGIVMNVLAFASLKLKAVWRQPWPIRMLIWVIVGSIPGTFILAALGMVFLGNETLLQEATHRLYFKLCIISSAICLFDLRVFAMSGRKSEPKVVEKLIPVMPDQAQLWQFLNLLRPDIGSDVISISTQDHYLDVTTALGNDLVHGKLSEVAQKLETLPGVRLHRSHWAAVTHIQRLHRQGSGHIVCLSDGRELPVSRSQLPLVREALGLS